jgi:hypothetical protein
MTACLLPSRILGLVRANCMEKAYLEKLTVLEIVQKSPEFNRKGSCSLVFTAA